MRGHQQRNVKKFAVSTNLYFSASTRSLSLSAYLPQWEWLNVASQRADSALRVPA